jgi:tetratricopeptide (TPR) repeat protein
MENSPIKILFLAPDPSNAARLRLGEELREIQDKLNDRDKFELSSRWAVRPRDVLRTIVDTKPQIVHFSGHGTETGELCMEDEQGNVQPIQPEALAALFKLVPEYVKCIVINTCFSEPQAKAIAEHIPFVIGMREEIGDKAAIEFAVGFYTALEADQSIEKIEQAFELGRVQIQLSGIPAEHNIPTLIFGDPRKRFRVEVEQVRSRLQKTDSMSANILRKALLEKGKRMKLSTEEAESIINEVLELIKDFKRKLQQYEQAFKEAIRNEFPIEGETREALQYFQQELGLREEDVSPIENEIINNPRWQSPEAFFDRAVINNRMEEYQIAIKYCTKAIELRQAYSGAYAERGTAYHRSGDMLAAIEDYTCAIEKNSYWEDRSLSGTYLERGLAHYYLGEKENHSKNMNAAIKDWTETINLQPNYSLAYYNRGLAHSALDNREEAIKDYTQAIEINGDWGSITIAKAFHRRGLLFQALGENQAANQDIQKAIELMIAMPEYQDFHSGLENFPLIDKEGDLNGKG